MGRQRQLVVSETLQDAFSRHMPYLSDKSLLIYCEMRGPQAWLSQTKRKLAFLACFFSLWSFGRLK